MSLINILIVCSLSFIVSIFSVTVGGTSLITVPLLISFGMVSKNAVATNMFALAFLSMSGGVGFRKETAEIPRKMLALFYILTIFGSMLGASLIVVINKEILKKVIGVMIIVIGGSLFFAKELGIRERKEKISKIKFVGASLSILILGIYGGFFSGGYVTLLSYVFILVLGLDFLQAAYITKIFNVLSSLAASAFFYYHGLIHFKAGIPLALSMSLGAFLGTKLAVRKGNLWIRNIFIITVILLAVKLFF
jgi:uncharacterized membrane protein YfcA